MKLVFVFLAIVAASRGVPLTMKLGERVINGEDVKEGEIPYQVSLQISPSFHFCGGSILNKNYVITAAHCVANMNPEHVTVVAATVDLKKPGSVHYVSHIIVHDQYRPSLSAMNDIALVKVKEPFQLSETLSYVPMPKKGEEIRSGAMAVVSGWGSTEEGGRGSNILQRTDVLITSHEYCNRVNSASGFPVYKESHVCAYDPEVFTGPCHGDSGGPLTVQGKLVGIASWVVGCASRENPTVYTRVPEFIDWIETHAI